MKKRLVSFFVIFAMLLSVSFTVANAAVISEGKCGDTVNYSLTDDGTLTISGKGDMWTDMFLTLKRTGGTAPWYGKYIRKIVVEEGVISVNEVCTGIFHPTARIDTNLEEIYLPSTLESINDAFWNCKSIKEVYIPEGCIAIGTSTFNGSGVETVYMPSTLKWLDERIFNDTNIKDVYYGGTEAQWVALHTHDVGEIDGTEFVTRFPPQYEDGTIKFHFNAKDNHPLQKYVPDIDKSPLPSEWARATIQEIRDRNYQAYHLYERPRDGMNRRDTAEAVVWVWWEYFNENPADKLRNEGIEIVNPFTDAQGDGAVAVMYSLGLIKGVGGGKFNPNGTVTRAEFAAIVTRTAEKAGFNVSGYSHNFTDAKGHWSSSQLGWASAKDIIAGVGGGKFEPNRPVTREEALVMCHRFLKVMETEKPR